MKITAVTKFKQGDLWHVLKQLKLTQKELARRCRCKQWKARPWHISEFINMHRRPDEIQAKRMNEVFVAAGVHLNILDIWPEAFKGFPITPVLERTMDIPVDRLLPNRTPHPLLLADRSSVRTVLDKSLATLEPLQRYAIEKSFYDDMTYADIAQSWFKKHGSTTGKPLCRARVDQHIKTGLKRLRHASRPVVATFKQVVADELSPDSFSGCPELRVDVEALAAKELAGEVLDDCELEQVE